MMAFIQYTMQIIMAFLMICMISVMLPRAAVSATRVDEVLKSETKINDPETAARHLRKMRRVKLHLNMFRSAIRELKKMYCMICHLQQNRERQPRFIGSTGSGKSTLVNLIPRFYDVTEGKITIDGTDIREVSQHDLRDPSWICAAERNSVFR